MDRHLVHQRLFIAVPVPDRVKNALAEGQAHLRRATSTNGVRWSSPAQWHLTLKFLGDVEAARIPELTGAIQNACSGAAPFPLAARGTGFFPDARSPRVVWIGVHDAGGALAKLQSSIETAAGRFTTEKPEKQFTAHITLGRIGDINRSDAKRLSAAAAAIGDRVFGQWQADRVDLVRSELNPGSEGHGASGAAVPAADSRHRPGARTETGDETPPEPAGGDAWRHNEPRYTIVASIPLRPDP